ncbi:hypothetical protein ACQKMV_22880 [Lysinibacillus sp. NPDC094403]|uniref:hypothetical protein n=1 Tax=Lysinibacillus sp. NPDC094403 TaxID=3390581 RepID=UPI003D038706
MHLELTNQTLATILLDCMHHYPSYKKAKEAFGVILGATEPTSYIGEYSFPIGNVDFRAQDEVSPNKQINQMIMNARKLVATSTSIASYHSHPFDGAYVDWARPSNEDCHYFINEPLEIQLIVALAQIYDESKPYKLVYKKDSTKEFIPNDNMDADPIEKTESTETQYIQGHFQNVAFEIRAYLNTESSLKDIDLFSSEVELNQTLWQHDVHLEQLPAEAMYSIRKLEYAHRQKSQKNASDKIDYHLEKVKKLQIANPIIPTEDDYHNIRFINGLLLKEATSLSYKQAIQLARKGNIFADLHEDSVVLCQVLFDEQANVLFLEDLEKEVGSTIDLADYMVENGYFEEISLCNIRKFPLTFWVLEDKK